MREVCKCVGRVKELCKCVHLGLILLLLLLRLLLPGAAHTTHASLSLWLSCRELLARARSSHQLLQPGTGRNYNKKTTTIHLDNTTTQYNNTTIQQVRETDRVCERLAGCGSTRNGWLTPPALVWREFCQEASLDLLNLGNRRQIVLFKTENKCRHCGIEWHSAPGTWIEYK